MTVRLHIGVDIGQAHDPTAIVVTQPAKYMLPDGDPSQRRSRFTGRALPEIHHHVRWIERLPLGTPYQSVADRVVGVAESCKKFGSVTTVVDQTGVGRPVIELIRTVGSGLTVRGVTLTSGDYVNTPSPFEKRIPKRELVSALEIVLQTGRIHVAPGIQLADDLRAELAAFQFEISARGHDTYEAASGKHDDLVIATCLAVYWGEKNPGTTDMPFVPTAEEALAR